MHHHAAVALPQHGDEEGAASFAGLVVDDLVGQDGLACAGWPLDQVEAAAQEAAAQHRVEAWHKACHPLDLAFVGIRLMLRHACPIRAWSEGGLAHAARAPLTLAKAEGSQ